MTPVSFTIAESAQPLPPPPLSLLTLYVLDPIPQYASCLSRNIFHELVYVNEYKGVEDLGCEESAELKCVRDGPSVVKKQPHG